MKTDPRLNDEDAILEILPRIREEASKVGPLHAVWDAIFDVEALLEGRPTLVAHENRETALKFYRDMLERRVH